MDDSLPSTSLDNTESEIQYFFCWSSTIRTKTFKRNVVQFVHLLIPKLLKTHYIVSRIVCLFVTS
jgi:hypothetical protein